MKVKLLARKGANKAGSVVEFDEHSARWLISRGYAEEVKATAPEKAPEKAPELPADELPPAPRRGRPRKETS